jgi:hypothetical protein
MPGPSQASVAVLRDIAARMHQDLDIVFEPASTQALVTVGVCRTTRSATGPLVTHGVADHRAVAGDP